MSKTLGSLPVGALVKDAASKYYGVPIIWQIADKNHEGYPENSTTLITERIIKIAGFDGKEADNANTFRKANGNNRYRTSNLRQWLNSAGGANSWWQAQNLTDGTENTNNHDAPPTTNNTNTYNGYDTENGFMDNLSVKFKANILTTTLTVAKNTVTDGGGSETVQDKIFLASTTEVGLTNENSIAEGSKLAIFSDDNSRHCNPTAEAVTNSTSSNENLAATKPWHWWLRTPVPSNANGALGVSKDGTSDSFMANSGNGGVRPLCNLSSDVLVSDEPDSDGAYVLDLSNQTITLNDMAIGDIVKISENGAAVNYIIVHKGLPSDMYDSSCDGVWLLREQAHSRMAWNANRKNDYENSDINAWLNGTFLNTIDIEIREAIKTVKIPFKKGAGTDFTPVQYGSNGLSCKVFLLSGYEVNFTTDIDGIVVDGAKLSYFLNSESEEDAKAKRICKYSNGAVADWWWRSPHTKNSSAWIVRMDGTCGAYSVDNNFVARPALILPPTLLVKDDGTVVVNNPPTVTSDQTGDLGTFTDGFTFNYTVNDEDGDSVTVNEYLDDVLKRTYTATLGAENTLECVTAENWQTVLNGTHTLKIIANDGKDDSEPYTVTFTKKVTSATITLSEPLPADDVISTAILTYIGELPADTNLQILMTNNANDSEPVWEDATADVQKGFNHVFTNQTAVNGFAFNFRIIAERGASDIGGFISNIGGAFE